MVSSKRIKLVLIFLFIFSFCNFTLYGEEPSMIEPLSDEYQMAFEQISQEKPQQEIKQESKEEPIAIEAGRSFNGENTIDEDFVNLAFDNADIRDVIKVLAAKSDMNIIVGEDVKANVTMKLKDVIWESALELILNTYNLTYQKEGNLIRVMTLTEAEEVAKKVPMITKIIPLNFAQTAEMSASIAKMLSARGSVQENSRTNTLIITDIPSRVRMMEETIEKLDTPTPQVLINVLIVDITLTDSDDLGVDWQAITTNQLADLSSANRSKTATLTQPSNMSSTGGPAFTLALVKKFGEADFTANLQAWIENKEAKVLANPRILTLDNQEAKIEIINQFPYLQTSSSSDGGTTSGTEYKNIGTSLSVTAHITNDGHITLNLKPSQDINAGSDSTTGAPIVDTRSAETNVLVRDGQTVALGGLRRVDRATTVNKVPILGDIPFIGKIFQNRQIDDKDVELVMFVTPYIIKDAGISEEEKIFIEANLPGPQRPFSRNSPFLLEEKYDLRPPVKKIKGNW
ncbi:MAG: type IV pilus secretin PilQ [Candidatus Gygaella obscura]|nr:type IV pilus secretin PilQ [Candidatus Gygaella obscura]